MKCLKCGYNNKDWATSCTSCGKDFRVFNEDKEEKESNLSVFQESLEKETQPEVKSPYPYENAMKVLQHIVNHKSEVSRKIFSCYFCLMILITTLLCDNLHKYYKNILLTGFILFIISLVWAFLNNVITARNYYNIPTSKDRKNIHHCIFCGATAITKNYIPYTPIASHHCSACGEFLYYKFVKQQTDHEPTKQ